jgi:TonB family protein
MNRAIFAFAGLMWTCCVVLAQDERPSVTVVKLGDSIYPPMALAARVSGEVKLNVTITPDGSEIAITVQSGPAMLRQAAVDSATRAVFRANGNASGGTYPVTCRFVLEDATKCGDERDSSYPHIGFDQNVVTITEQPALICDPAGTVATVRFRSIRCLYLWRCGYKTP